MMNQSIYAIYIDLSRLLLRGTPDPGPVKKVNAVQTVCHLIEVGVLGMGCTEKLSNLDVYVITPFTGLNPSICIFSALGIPLAPLILDVVMDNPNEHRK